MTGTLRLGHDEPFDLQCTLSCGQLFRWEREQESGWWHGVVGGRFLRLRQHNGILEYEGAEEDFIRHYFQLDLDLDSILCTVDRDALIHAAIVKHRGLRLVRQDPWECLISYICAQNANIPFIRRMIANISACYGEPLETPYGVYEAFPSAAVLASCTEEALRGCSLGYRARYIHQTATMVAEDPGWQKRIRILDYEDGRRELMQFSGVGPKVADCILLFAFEQFVAFPVDVWIRKLMKEVYLKEECGDRPVSCREYEHIRKFAQEYFGPYAGYAQEYLFASARGLETL